MKIFIPLAAITLLASCASPKMGSVIPQKDGVYQVEAMGYTEAVALESALHTASTTCKERNMRHVVLDRKTEYKGMVAEDTNRMINKGAGIIAVASKSFIPTLSNEDDYRLTMKFSCEA